MTNLNEMKAGQLIDLAIEKGIKWRVRIEGKDVKMKKDQLIAALEALEAVKVAATKTFKLTDLETRVLRSFVKDNFYEEGFESGLWVSCFLDTVEGEEEISPKQTRAVLVSLQKKEMLTITTDGTDKVLYLQENGRNWLAQNVANLDEEGFEE